MSLARERFRRGRAVPWTPWNIPRSLHGDWWSARDHAISSLMTDDGAGLISSWKGRIAGLEMTASGTARPQYSATGFNGAYPALSGNGSSVVMGRESTSGLPTSTTPSFIAFVGGGYGQGDTIVACGAGTSLSRQIDTSSTPLLRGRATGTIVTSANAGDSLMVCLFICEASRLRIRINGVETVLTNTLGSLSAGRTRFFATSAVTPAAFAAGPLSEVIIAPTWPEADYLRLEGWMAAEYGLALADGHPYKGSAP